MSLRKAAHICSVCGKDAKGNAKLVIHTRSHSGERPYICPTCGKRFTANSNLTRHANSQHGVSPNNNTTAESKELDDDDDYAELQIPDNTTPSFSNLMYPAESGMRDPRQEQPYFTYPQMSYPTAAYFYSPSPFSTVVVVPPSSVSYPPDSERNPANVEDNSTNQQQMGPLPDDDDNTLVQEGEQLGDSQKESS